MVREVITYPNRILRQKSKDVVEFDSKLHTLLDDMNDTMLHFGGVGLAAIQVGVALNVLIINIPDENDNQIDENLIEAVNPVITSKSGEILFKEGCLSVPGFNEQIKRANEVTVSYYDRFGKHHTMECEEFLAVAWQHELEHLSGHLFIENLSYLKRKRFEKEFKKSLKKSNKRR